MIIFEVEPMGKPRMTRSDRWKKRDCTTKYWELKDELAKQALVHKFKMGSVIDLIFVIPFPESWSQKKRQEMNGKPHQAKPDNDNLIKAFCDCLSEDDCHIWHISARKFWGEKGAIVVLRNEDKLGHFELDKNDYIASNPIHYT